MSKESSIIVAVRVRPFTAAEERNLVLQPEEQQFAGDGSLAGTTLGGNTMSPYQLSRGVRRVVSVVDDRMLIFDPPETNPLTKMQQRAFPNATSRIREHRFVFDRLFDVDTQQEEVYEHTTRPLLDSVLDGFNATVFAYGATGCGKTHTILGTLEQPGVIFLTMKELYMRMDELKDTKHLDISLSYLEIYNETIRDLLSPETLHKKLILREDAEQKILVANLLTHTPNSVEEVMAMILEGNSNRTSSPTEANATSLRLHAVLQINVVQRDRTVELEQCTTVATLSIIDLAGSERAAATRNRGARLHEGANINKSLLALGNCINALCDPKRRNHVPYRDSKLTRLLKFLLGGNCKTVMIVCVSPLLQHYDETLNTLKYANRAKEIKTKVIRNQHNLDRHVGLYLKMITQQKEEIEELRAREKDFIAEQIIRGRELGLICLQETLKHLNSIRKRINVPFNPEKWQKYFLLCKRKLLLLQKCEVEGLLDTINDQKIINLSEQLISKVNFQVEEAERQYSSGDELTKIIEDQQNQAILQLEKLEGWTTYHVEVFKELIQSLKESLEREILFNSSILFDHVIHQLDPFLMGLVNERSEDVIGKLTRKLETLVSGEYDSQVESCTAAFMKLKMYKQTVDESMNGEDEDDDVPDRYRFLTQSSLPQLFQKRSHSPVKVSKPLKKPVKAVRWDGESDMSMGDISIDNNTFFENEVPASDLDLSFNPTIESPPSKPPPSTHNILEELKPQLRAPSSIPIKSFLNQEKKTPLLNKGASKVVETVIPNGANTSPFKNKLNSLGAPSRVINNSFPPEQELARNVHSNGSEKVD